MVDKITVAVWVVIGLFGMGESLITGNPTVGISGQIWLVGGVLLAALVRIKEEL